MRAFLLQCLGATLLLSWLLTCCALPPLEQWSGSNLPAHLTTTEAIAEALQVCPHDNEAYIRTDVLTAMLEEAAPLISKAEDPSALAHFFYPSNTGDFAAHQEAFDSVLANNGQPSAALPRMPCGPVDEVLGGVDLQRLVQGCKVVVATAILNKHDILHPPAPSAFPDQVCYIAWVDNSSAAYMERKGYVVGEKCEGWQVIRYDKNITGNARLDSRIFKILLPRLLPPSVRWSIWLDSKHRLDVDPIRVLYITLWQYNATWAGPKHGNRISIHDEQNLVVELRMLSRERMMQQRQHHLSHGFSINKTTGLLDGCLHVRDHGSFATHLLSCAWWNELVRFPPRDQLSFNYLVYRMGYKAAVTPQQFLAMRPFLKSVNQHTLGFNLMYDMRSALFNSTIHVAARCDFLSMMPLLHHVVTYDTHAKLMHANNIMSSVARAEQNASYGAATSWLLRGKGPLS